ncbi:SixA phosphatase family protein [Rubricoccus marinus]|uniref:Histidine phosphatase family protein n=1 Tax=Rubricoccus marinus TaxID=716817 RepID=A0A259U310_9BACT|nr:phosphoglycerate mutase family protein [Rubricoccus marinus]OZC04237.1 hypothetical protein BSZ36_15360 [Rubricoccus marinus]
MRALLSSFAVLIGCTGTPEVPPPTTVYLVRHAEAADDGSRDPALSARGHERARRLAMRIGRADAVYATPYRRTRQTAAPLAKASGVEVVVVPIGDGGVPGYVDDVVARVQVLPRGSVAVVVGHSNTTPQVAGAFSGEALAPLDHDQYDQLFVVSLDAADHAILVTTAY